MSKKKINEAKMLEEIRLLLNLSIADFTFQMDWPNVKYYDYIKNGRLRKSDQTKIKARPTIFKVFAGINYALDHYELWAKHREAITAIVLKNLLPSGKTQ